MNTDLAQTSSGGHVALGWHIAFWATQLLLAGLFGSIGFLKLTMAPTALGAMGIAWAIHVPVALLRFVGAAELAGAVGVILPALTRILPFLTPLAATGFATIQILAIGFHGMRGELFAVLPINLMLLALSLFVVWGRARKAPIQAR